MRGLVSLTWPMSPDDTKSRREREESRPTNSPQVHATNCGLGCPSYPTFGMQTRTIRSSQEATSRRSITRNYQRIEAIKLPIITRRNSRSRNTRQPSSVNTMNSWFYLICLLTFVPINTVTCFNQQYPYQTNASHLYNHRPNPVAPTLLVPQLIRPPPIIQFTSSRPAWPQQINGTPMQQQQQRRAAPPVAPLQRRDELQQPLLTPYQAYQLQPVRPAKLMAEYVANQGQRILKNLVNTTIADLVAQSTMKINANKNSGSFPSMGKLYTLLFPTPSPLIAFTPIIGHQHATTKSSTIINQTAGDQETTAATGGETAGVLPSSLSSSDNNSELFVGNELGREEKQQFLSLSAPYDSRPRRPTISRGLQNGRSRLNGIHPTSEPPSLEAGEEWRRPDTDVGGLSQESNLFEHHQLDSPSVGEDLTETSALKTDIDTDSLSSYDSNDLMQANQPREVDTDTRKPLIIREAELYSSSRNLGETALQNSMSDEQHARGNFTPELEFTVPYVRSRVRSKQPEFSNHSVVSFEHQLNGSSSTPLRHHGSMDDFDGTNFTIQSQESVDVGTATGVGGSTIEGAEFVQIGRSQRQPKHYQPNSGVRFHLPNRHKYRDLPPGEEESQHSRHHQNHALSSPEQDAANHMNETRTSETIHGDSGIPVHGNYATEEPNASGEQSAPKGFSFTMNDSTTSQPDDSYFTAHLPSQYDSSVMHTPPEGYYDDYFKPSGSVSGQASLSPPPTSSYLGNPIETHHYETVADDTANYTTGSDQLLSRRKHSVPSYKSEIVASESDNNTSGYSFPQPTEGHTQQYFTSQQLSGQNSENPGDGLRMEFLTSNRTSLLPDDKLGLEGLNYEVPQEAAAAGDQRAQAQNVTLELIPDGEQQARPNGTHFRYQPGMRNTSLAGQSIGTQLNQHSAANEDSIKVIIANTVRDQRDPQSNEKLINYTSDGFNITRGNSPRNNFINKDMNEFPHVGQTAPELPQQNEAQDSSGGQAAPPSAALNGGSQRGLMLQPAAFFPGTGSMGNLPQHIRQRQAQQQQQLVPHYPRPAISLYRATPVPAQADPGTDQPQLSATEPSDSANEQQPEPQAEVEAADQQQSRRPLRQDQHSSAHSVDGRDLRQQVVLQPSEARGGNRQSRVSMLPALDVHEQQHSDHHHHHVQQQQQVKSHAPQQPQDLSAGTNEEEPDRNDSDAPPKGRGGSAARVHHHHHQRRTEERKRERRNRLRGGKFSRQQTLARPQITQVNFDPKELPLHAPTPLPSASESPLEAIAEIPHKVEKLRENQPDKNELMNELLTALDRVKVAIYKLQPLTAKMNAIYRKSVTSNTRDIVMDNHKGTYAKRYPPGDYDDSYDRMHPSELLNRHQSQRSASQRNDNDPKQEQDNSNNQAQGADAEGNESVENAVYLPAPKEVLEMHKRRDASSSSSSWPDGGQVQVANVELDSLNTLESKLIATGIGRRLGNGRVAGRLSLDSGERLIYDDEEAEESANSNVTIDRAISSFFPPLNQSASEEGELQEPLFGYRITIFRSPEADELDEAARPSEQFAYQVDGASESERDTNGEDEPPEEDSMATSESSFVSSTQQPIASEELGPSVTIADPNADLLEGSESKGKEMQEKKKSKKSQLQKKKKNEEESKKKKEYKKIKHNKGIVSKEKKTMHRDKHIKAHDRGAAKEKALKERTQIEFFEREQIVDDEFEKGKKSTVKGGWQSGHDSKKSIKENGDTMSSGGSHFVKHESKDTEKGHKVSSEASSAKKSNKFEKKQMEAKGKKFKGWREKGYKIITETEFIDRGSLHDSGYKKRDKGAAHHQKFKKQEASSEGHHGSMLEHHKKSNKKEEKKSNEKKGDEMKKKKKPKKKKEDDHDHDESVMRPTSEPDEDKELSVYTEEGSGRKESRRRDERRTARNQQPMLMSATSSTFRPAILVHSPDSSQTKTLIRLLNTDVHDEQQPIRPNRADGYQVVSNDGPNVTLMTRPEAKHYSSSSSNNNNEPALVSKYHILNETAYDTNRRSDISTALPTKNSLKNSRSLFSNSSLLDRERNSTILDIFDNLTGRQINKTKIGTYDLEDHHTIRLNGSNGINHSNGNSSTPLVKISNGLAKYFPFLSQATQISNRAPSSNSLPNLMPPSMNSITTTSTTTTTAKPYQLKSSQMRPSNINQRVNRLDIPLNLHNHNLIANNNQLLVNHNHNDGSNQVYANHQPPRSEQTLNNQLRFNQSPNLIKPIENPTIKFNNLTTRAPGLITPEQANAAAQLLQLVHRANQVTQVNLPNHQPPNLMDLQHQQQQHLNALQSTVHRAAFIPPTMTNSYQPAPLFPPTQVSFSPPNTLGFGAEQFLDYEHDPILQHHGNHNFLTD